MGLVWGLWSFPRAWVPGEEFDIVGFVWLISGTMISAVLYTWMFNASNGGLIPALILHTSQALTLQFLSKVDAPAVEFVISLAIVILVVWKGLEGSSLAHERSKSSLKVEDLPLD